MQIIFSGLTTQISVNHHDFEDVNDDINRISVLDSPFTIKRGLLTKSLYNTNSVDSACP